MSFIVSLKYQLEMDTLEQFEYFGVVDNGSGIIEFRRSQDDHLTTEINPDKKQPSAPPFDPDVFVDASAPFAPLPQTSKNLFILNIGANNDFLRRADRMAYLNANYDDEQKTHYKY